MGNGEWSEIWSFTIKDPTGIFGSDDDNSESYQLYPKPVEDILNISGIDAFPVRIKIISGSGQTLDDKFIGEGLVNVQHLMPGMYYLMIETSGESVIKRFIKR